jgi:hypothetical protein
VLAHPDYYALREELIGFLEAQGHRGAPEGGASQPVNVVKKREAVA